MRIITKMLISVVQREKTLRGKDSFLVNNKNLLPVFFRKKRKGRNIIKSRQNGSDSVRFCFVPVQSFACIVFLATEKGEHKITQKYGRR